MTSRLEKWKIRCIRAVTAVIIATQYKRNAVNLRIQLIRLQEAKDRVQHYMSEARKNGQEIYREAEEIEKRWLRNRVQLYMSDTRKSIKELRYGKYWLEYVNKTLEEGNEVLVNMKSKPFRLRHQAFALAEYAYLLSDIVQDTLEDGFFNSSFGEIMKAMEDANFQTIGIWGLCGVGITTLAKTVAREAEQDELFDVVLMLTVPPNQDEIQIQQLLADGLGLKFAENDTMETRAIQLFERIRKEQRILVILDHIEDEINLETLGLPIGDDHKGCKILLTSESCDVLTTKMGAQKVVQVDHLSKEEGWDLFVKMGGDIVAQDSDLQSKAKDIMLNRLNSCPLLIGPLVKALRNKHVSEWNTAFSSYGRDEYRPYSGSQIQVLMHEHFRKISPQRWETYEIRYICSALILCYDHLKSEEAKLLFLVIGWIGSSYISKYHLFLLGIGFGLFNQVDTLEDGRRKLQELIDELKGACLLIEDQEDSVIIHEIICSGVITILSESDLNVFSQQIGSKVDEEWQGQSCHLIFKHLSHLSNLSNRANTLELRVLIMGADNDMNSLEIPESYFERMEKLKVLHFRGLIIFPSLLPSLHSLKSLKVLSLFGCHLIDVPILAQLTNLEVLRLHKSNIQTLTKEVGQLRHLRLLDLENSSIHEIVPGVLSMLESLEELYLGSTNICWGVKHKNNELSTKATLNELGALNRLTTLDITVRDVQAWPTDLFFKCHLKFRILVGDLWLWDDKDTHQTLKLQQYGNIQSDQGIQVLLKVVEHLVLDETPGLKNVLCDLNAEGLSKLKYLDIKNNIEIVFIVDLINKIDSHPAFPNLISLVLHGLGNLKCICRGPLAMDSFCKLSILKVTCCNKIKNLLPFSIIRIIPQLVEIEASKCMFMEEILLLEEENVNQQDSHIEFSCLQSLIVCDLPALICFCSKEMKSSTLQWSSEKQMGTKILNEINEEYSSIAFFNEKVAFPKLETLYLSSLNFDNLWGDQLFGISSNTQNLTKLTIEKFGGLKYLFSISMLRCLQKLKHLEIKNCPMMEDIFVMDEIMEETNNHVRDDFNEKIFFPNLKTMIVDSMENLRSMWHNQLATPYSFCKLKKIKIRNCWRLSPIFPTYIISNLNDLCDLSVDNCNLLEDISNLEDPIAKKSAIVYEETSSQEPPSKSVFHRIYHTMREVCCLSKMFED